MQQSADHKGCGTSGGGGKASCGSGAGANDLPPEIWEKVKNHPCYSEEAHHHYARMHVAVAPACNIQCNYCNRKYDCANESRPGVVSEKLTPEQAAKKVLAVASAIPQMTVLGIAGPGDPLANPDKTFRTFELISKTAPDIKLCLSTNGLALPDHVDTIAKYKVDHVTITINMVDADIGAAHLSLDILESQALHRPGGRTAAHRAAAARARDADRTRHPLQGQFRDDPRHQRQAPGGGQPRRQIPRRVPAQHHAADLRTRAWHRVRPRAASADPTAQELKALQDELRRRNEHDASLPPVPCGRGGIARRGPQRRVQHRQGHGDGGPLRRRYAQGLPGPRRGRTAGAGAARQQELAALAGENSDIKVLVAVATKGSGLINEHFGHAKEFQVYELSTAGAKFVGHRRVDLYCQGGYGEEDSLATIIRAINDCHAVFVAKIGGCPKSELAAGRHRPG